VPNDPAENPQPDVDVTVGSTPLVGDAPPSEGTGVDVTVSPTTTALHRIFRASERHAVLEGLDRGRVRVGSVPPLPASGTMAERATASGCGAIAYGFHTASARAAACPDLQPELESSGSALFWGLVSAQPGGD
jgi:hypothetical protein